MFEKRPVSSNSKSIEKKKAQIFAGTMNFYN